MRKATKYIKNKLRDSINNAKGSIYYMQCLKKGHKHYLQYYVGQTINSIEERIKSHVNNTYNDNSKDLYVNKIIREVGEKNFREIVSLGEEVV